MEKNHLLIGEPIPVVEDLIRHMVSIIIGHEQDIIMTTFVSSKVVKYTVHVHNDDYKVLKKKVKELRLAVSKWSSRYHFYGIVEIGC